MFRFPHHKQQQLRPTPPSAGVESADFGAPLFCLLFLLAGSHFTGQIPHWIATCFPHLKELDLSYGRLSGTIPSWRAPGKLHALRRTPRRVTPPDDLPVSSSAEAAALLLCLVLAEQEAQWHLPPAEVASRELSWAA